MAEGNWYKRLGVTPAKLGLIVLLAIVLAGVLAFPSGEPAAPKSASQRPTDARKRVPPPEKAAAPPAVAKTVTPPPARASAQDFPGGGDAARPVRGGRIAGESEGRRPSERRQRSGSRGE